MESGRLPIATVDDAVTRVLRAKATLGLHEQRLVDVQNINRVVGQASFRQAAKDIADRGITLLRDEKHLLPLKATQPLRVFLAAIAGDPDRTPGAELERELRWRCRLAGSSALRYALLPRRICKNCRHQKPTTWRLRRCSCALPTAKVVWGLPPEQAALVDQLLAGRKPAIVACFGSPYVVEWFPKAATWLAAFSTADVTEGAMGRALFGEIAVSGHLPVSVPGAQPALAVGAGLKLAADAMKLASSNRQLEKELARASEILNSGVKNRAFPGGVLAVGVQGGLSVRAFGRQSYGAASPAVSADTIYDLASLTKPW